MLHQKSLIGALNEANQSEIQIPRPAMCLKLELSNEWKYNDL